MCLWENHGGRQVGSGSVWSESLKLPKSGLQGQFRYLFENACDGLGIVRLPVTDSFVNTSRLRRSASNSRGLFQFPWDVVARDNKP